MATSIKIGRELKLAGEDGHHRDKDYCFYLLNSQETLDESLGISLWLVLTGK